MKIPIEWLKEYIDIKKSPLEIAESFTTIGLLLDKPIEKNVLDLEHRMDRADWLGIIGCARDLATFENLKLKNPKYYDETATIVSKKNKIDVRVKDGGFVNRFYTQVFRGVTVKDSPKWLRDRLKAYGIPSINNVVDITNYVMVEMGQTLHAQDTDKMEKPEIVIRKGKNGEKITTLLGEVVEIDDSCFVLAQGNKPTVIGGIVGGRATAVDGNTKNIILDSGNYNQSQIRKSSRKMKIQNESVLRNDKFLHPNATEFAVRRATKLILELAGGKVLFNDDYYPVKHKPQKMVLRMGRVKKIGGLEIDKKKIINTLEKLEYKVLHDTADRVTVEIPYFRTDVSVEDDIVADILRMYNYNKFPRKILNTAPPTEITPDIYNFEDEIRDTLVRIGLHEHITDPLVPDGQIKLINALSKEKSALRTTIRETLLPIANTYKKHGLEKIGLFEIGKIYLTKEIRVVEVLSKDPRITLATLLHDLGIQKYQLNKKMEHCVSININTKTIGHLDIKGFTLFTKKLMGYSETTHRITTKITNRTTEDLSLIINRNEPFGPIYNKILNYDKHIVDAKVMGEYTGSEIDKDHKSVLIKISYDISHTKEIRKALIKNLKKNFGLIHRE